MKKIYSFVLMATMLLIGTNVWADNVAKIVRGGEEIQSYQTLQAAFDDALDGDKIVMLSDYTMVKKVKKLAVPAEVITLGKNVDPKTLTLDFNGFTVSSENDRMIELYRGTLNLTNSRPQLGGGLLNDNAAKHRTIWVFGSILKNCDPSQANSETNPYYTHLNIGAGVEIESKGFTAGSTDKGGIAVMVHRTGDGVFNGNNNKGAQIYGRSNPAADGKEDPRGVANGVRIDVYGTLKGSLYAIQTNGEIACPDAYYQPYYNEHRAEFYETDTVSMNWKAKESSPYIHIHDGARLENVPVADATLSKGQVALYTSGYARWYVEGTCEGTTGVYIKSGQVTLDNAIVNSTAATASEITSESIGVNGGGNAVVVESNAHYSGNIQLNVEGDTEITTEADGGAALLETIAATTTESEVEHIAINGGTLTGDKAIVISDQTAGEGTVEVIGTTLTGAFDVTDQSAVIPSTSYTTIVTNEDGSTSIIVDKGTAPTPENTGSWAEISGKTNQNVKWSAIESVAIENGTTIKLAELQIVSGTDDSHKQVLTIANGGTLEVGRLMMNAYAQIVVEAGGKLIVKDEAGITAQNVNNIILKTSATAQALFLLSPDVTYNRHPKATVEFIATKSYMNSTTDYQYERFGIPTYTTLEDVKCNVEGLRTDLFTWENNNWQYQGALYKDVPYANVANFKKPFISCNLLSRQTKDVRDSNPARYQFFGALNGNSDAVVNCNLEWNPLANSFSGEVDVVAYLEGLESGVNVDKTIYLATPAGLGTYNWDPVDARWAEGEKLKPMQAFILHNHGNDPEESTIKYDEMVWTPATTPAAPGAPRRFAAANELSAKLRIIVARGEYTMDNLKMSESAENNHNAVKYMNDDVNIYATAEDKYGIVAAEDLNDTYVGFSTVEGGEFTISFANVAGREFDLIDLETGARVAIAEGETYNFHMAANTTNDYRFKVVERKVATAMENTEAVKSAKGIYTITGQYVGEMNVWNSLPAGVYVINGAKCVK